MKKRVLLLIMAVLPLLFCSCGGGGGGGGSVIEKIADFFYSGNQPNDRTGDTLGSVSVPSGCPTSGSVYTFLIITDIHFGAKGYGTVPLEQIKTTITSRTSIEDKPAFIAVLGDVADNGLEGEYQQYADFISKVSAACGGARVLNVAGNHDLWNDGWGRWKKYATPGNSFYSFSVPEWNRSFYFTDTASGTMGKKQLQKFISVLKSDGNRKFVFTHYPFYGDKEASKDRYFVLADTAERNTLISLCANNKVDGVFCGHFHEPFYTTAPASFIEVVCGSLKKDKNSNRHWTFVKVNEAEKKACFTRYDVAGDSPSATKTEWTWNFK